MKCGIKCKLDECDYATLSGNGVGCSYEGICEYQRPRSTTSDKSEYVSPTAKLQQLRLFALEQKDLPAGIAEIVNDNFWELL